MKRKSEKFLLGVLLPVLVLGTGCGSTQKAAGPDEEWFLSSPAGTIFMDDFQQRSLEGWKKVSGSWRAGKGVLKQGSRDVPGEGVGFHLIILEEVPILDYRIETEFRFPGKANDEAFAGIVFRYQDIYNYYCFRMADFEKYQDRYEIYEFNKGQRHVGQGSGDVIFNPGQWYHLAVEVDGANIKAYFDGELVIDLDNPDLRIGTVGLATKHAIAEFRDFRVSEI